MGRWAQRRRGGGGGGAQQVIVMTVATLGTNNAQLFVTYSAAITAGNFTAGDFETSPGAVIATTVSQNGPTQLTIDFFADVDTDTSVTFSSVGPPLHVETPQTIAIT